MTRRRGVYTLADDGVVRWLEAFARSLRRYNPTLEAWLVPFSARLARTREVCARHGIEVLADPELERFDAIGRRVQRDHAGWSPTFRKLAVFEGPLDSFLFLDADVVVLDDLSALFAAFERGDADLAYFDRDIEQVYRPGALRRRMVDECGSAGFNTGAFLSRREALGRAEIAAAAAEAEPLSAGFHSTYEQPFLNFCFDRQRARRVEARALEPGLGPTWPGDPALARSDNVVALVGGGPPSGLRSPFVHWAGMELKWAMPFGALWRRFAPVRSRIALACAFLGSGLARRGRRLIVSRDEARAG